MARINFVLSVESFSSWIPAFSVVILRIKFTRILQRLVTDERCSLPFIELDKAVKFFYAQHFMQVGTLYCLCDYLFQKQYFLFVFRFLVSYLPAVLLPHFPYLSAVVCLHGIRACRTSMVSSWSATSRCRAVFSLSNVFTLLLPKREPILSAMLAAAVVATPFSFSVCISSHKMRPWIYYA